MKCNIFLMILNSKKVRRTGSGNGTCPSLSNLSSFISRIHVSQVRELIEVKEVITPYGRSGSEETIVFFRKT